MALIMIVANILRVSLKTKHCINFLHSRNISCLHKNFNKYLQREARVMQKMLGNKKTGKTPWYKYEGTGDIPPVRRMAAPKQGQNFRRTAVLNKLFMRHITDMMASGEVASEILGRGIEISRVKVAPDFNKVNVFWLARGTENDEDVEKILKKSAGQLRHELSELRVMGVVPYIEFVKDKQYAKIAEVDRILETADFGEGYIPLNVGHQFKSEFTLQTPLSPEIKSHIEELEEKIPEPSLPPMRMDVLGLKHEEILNKIKMAVKKSQAPHRHELGVPLASSTNSEPAWQNPKDANHDITFNLKKEDFKKFLLKRQLLQKKGFYSNSKKYSPEMDLHKSGVSEDGTIMSDFLESIDDEEEEDYIIEDEDVSFKNE